MRSPGHLGATRHWRRRARCPTISSVPTRHHLVLLCGALAACRHPTTDRDPVPVAIPVAPPPTVPPPALVRPLVDAAAPAVAALPALPPDTVEIAWELTATRQAHEGNDSVTDSHLALVLRGALKARYEFDTIEIPCTVDREIGPAPSALSTVVCYWAGFGERYQIARTSPTRLSLRAASYAETDRRAAPWRELASFTLPAHHVALAPDPTPAYFDPMR